MGVGDRMSGKNILNLRVEVTRDGKCHNDKFDQEGHIWSKRKPHWKKAFGRLKHM